MLRESANENARINYIKKREEMKMKMQKRNELIDNIWAWTACGLYGLMMGYAVLCIFGFWG